MILEKLKEKKSYMIILLLIGVVISTIILIIGIAKENFNIALIAVLILYLSCIIHTVRNLNYKMYYFLFLLVIFVFILSRPTISMFRGDEWWYFETECIKWSLISVYISLIGLTIGEVISDKLIRTRIEQEESKEKGTSQEQEISKDAESFIRKNKDIIRNVSFILLVLSFIAKMMVEIEKYIFMIGKDYAQYYIIYESNMPRIITFLAGTIGIFLTIYLITKPAKKMSIISLAMYSVTYVPMLLIGERGSIVTAVIFAAIYIWYRNSIENENKWITKRIKIVTIVSVPIIIIGLGIYNYTRSDDEIPTFNPLAIFTDFFYKQGVTYDVLNIGYNSLNDLPNKEQKNYTFGGFIDYLKYNSISTKIFNIEPLPSQNSVRKATEGNSFAHAMSYVAKEDYLDGHRLGVIIFTRIICRLWIFRNFGVQHYNWNFPNITRLNIT